MGLPARTVGTRIRREANGHEHAPRSREGSAFGAWDGGRRVRGFGVGLRADLDPVGGPSRIRGARWTCGRRPQLCWSRHRSGPRTLCHRPLMESDHSRVPDGQDGSAQRLISSGPFRGRLRLRVKGFPLDVPPGQGAPSFHGCVPLLAVRRSRCGPAGPRVPHAGDGPRAWHLNCEAHRLSLVHGFDRLLAWPSLRGVARYPHQERTCLRVLQEMRGRAILADEVGLGKTIEAGLVLKEYAIRGLVRRALILTPASLTGQWRGGMGTKFNLPVAVLASPGHW